MSDKKVVTFSYKSSNEKINPLIRSFDLFDTLLGRFHYFPESTFQLVEEKYPLPGFTFFRVAAQMKSDRTFPDVYRKLQEMIDLTDEQRDNLAAFEWEMELSQIFPIVENLMLVKDGDLIVSDTYYSEKQIREILDKIGLTKKVIVYATPFGKASGKIWDELVQKHQITAHLGDAILGDVYQAREHKISGLHYTGSSFTEEEKQIEEREGFLFACTVRSLRLQNPYVPYSSDHFLWEERKHPEWISLWEKTTALKFLDIQSKKESFFDHEVDELGYKDLANLMKVLREENPYSSKLPEYVLWHEQAQINIPLLIAASHYLHLFCQEKKIQRILFSSRDCSLWIQIFKVLYPQYESIYFHTSRHCYYNPTPSYISYVKQLYTEQTLIVDGYGRGLSCEVFFKEHIGQELFYLAIANSGDQHYGMVRVASAVELEVINTDVIGVLYDMVDNQPLRAPPEYDLCYVYPMHQCVEKALKLLSSIKPMADQKIIEWAIHKLKKGLVLENYLIHTCYHYHFQGKNGIEHKHCNFF